MAIKHTLGQAVADGSTGVMIYCISCSRSSAFPGMRAIELWGPNATFVEIATRSRCQRCGQQASQAAPEWPLHATGGASLEPLEWEDVATENPNRFPKRS